MKELLVARTAGFCYGVRHSVEMAEELLEEMPEVLCLGPLVHNDDVLYALGKKGLRIISGPGEAGEGDHVLIRAHGVPKTVEEELRSTGAVVHDATCPNVKAIHCIVEKASEEGRFVLIIGQKDHPEVLGIAGWCDASFASDDAVELLSFARNHPDYDTCGVTVVSQTTQTRTNYESCTDILKKVYTNMTLFDTICAATSKRQNEASELSARCDAMVVIGSAGSANSTHLAELCRVRCPNVQFVNSAEDLDLSVLGSCNTVGVTAGASAPSWVIKEVVNKMSDEVKVEQTFDDMLEDSLKPIYNGERVTGTVAGISGTEVTVDLGAKYSGFIPTSEFEDSGVKAADVLKIGDPIEAIVVRVNDVEGTAMLSKKRLDTQKFWEAVQNASEDGEIVEGTVTEVNKGGLVVNVKGIRVFVPASQSGLPKDADLNELLKKNVKLKITEFNKPRKRVVGSIRRALNAERKAAARDIWENIEVGKRYPGKVKSLTNYGAFVDIGGIDGMIHQSELTWDRIKHPSDVVNPGDDVEVYVIGFDKDDHRISLGLKDPDANPWKAFRDRFNVDDVTSVKIVKLMPFGAFAEVMKNVDGLIHISQLADHRIAKAEDAVQVGDVVTAKITAIDDDKQKISLSIRALLDTDPVEEAYEGEESGFDSEEND